MTSGPAENPGLLAAARKGLGVAAALLVVATVLGAMWVGFGDHGEAVTRVCREVDAPHLAVAWIIMTSGMVGLALRWRSFFPAGVRADLQPLTSILFVGMSLNYALPGPVGEFVGAKLAARRFGLATESALAAGIAARFVGLGISGLVSIALLAGGWVDLPADWGNWLAVAAVGVGGGACALAVLVAMPNRMETVADLTLGRLSLALRFRWLATLHTAVVRFAHALGSLGRTGWGPYRRAAFWALVGHALVVLGIWIAGHGLGHPPSVAGLVFTYAASTAGAILLVGFPGGQVGWDAMFASLLVSTAGLDVATALALTLAVRVQQLSLVVVGCVELARWLRNESAPSAG